MILGKKVRLRDKKLADVRHDYAWQSDVELSRLDAVAPLKMSFAQYLADYLLELRCPCLSRRLLAIESLEGKHIGNCTYYGIDEARGEAELGIMIGDRDYWDNGYGSDAVATLVGYIFRQTKIKRIYLKTLEDNHRAQKCFRKCRFVPYGHRARDGYRFLLMEVRREQWPARQKEKGAASPAKREG